MKKTFKNLSKILCLFLALIACVSFVGCETTTVYNDNYTYIDTETYPENNSNLKYNGVHDFTAPYIEGEWLIKNGKTDYTVVFPSDTVEASKGNYRYYMNEFLYFWEKATGFVPKVVVDTELPVSTHQADTKYISVGNTTLAKSSGVDYSLDAVDYFGGKVKMVDDNIYIVGYSDAGTLSAVYSFYQLTFNYQVYSSNTFVIDENVTDLQLRAYDVIDIPDAPYMATSEYEKPNFYRNYDYSRQYDHTSYDATMYGPRVRALWPGFLIIREITTEFTVEDLDANFEEYSEKYKKLGTTSGHNSIDVVKFSKWGESHSDWFMSGGSQLCFTCHGDEDEYELLTDLVAQATCMAFRMSPTEQYPTLRSVQFTLFDSPAVCTCDKCMEYKANGYTDSGIITRFLNTVAEKVDVWMDDPDNAAYAREDWFIYQAAYLTTMAASAHYDESSESWVPNNDEVVFHDNVVIEFCPGATDYQQSLFAAENKWVVDYMEQWKVLAEGRVSYFHYLNYTRTPNYLLDIFDFVTTEAWNYHIFDIGCVWMYSESVHGAAATEWGALLSFLTGMMTYNCTLDSGKLMRAWFDAQFGAASNIMFNLFNSHRLFNHYQNVKHENYKRASNNTAINLIFDWSKPVLTGWIDMCDDALEAIDYLKEIDIDEYNRIAYNIAIEAHSFIFILFDTCGDSLTREEYDLYKNRVLYALDTWPEYEMTQVGLGGTTLQWVATL